MPTHPGVERRNGAPVTPQWIIKDAQTWVDSNARDEERETESSNYLTADSSIWDNALHHIKVRMKVLGGGENLSAIDLLDCSGMKTGFDERRTALDMDAVVAELRHRLRRYRVTESIGA